MSLSCGVPQGSSLSHTLFNVYMSPLAEVVKPFSIQIVTYADDTQLIVSLNQANKDGNNLAECLVKVSIWMEGSFLKLNGTKMELMFLGKPSTLDINACWPSCLGERPLPKVKIKSLGVWLDQSLNFKEQARRVASTCYGILKMLRKIIPLLPFRARRLMIQALILSRLDYANVLYLGTPSLTIKKLQTVQNCAARLLTQAHRRESAGPLITSLHWLSVAERIQFKAMCIVHRSLMATGPPILCSIISLYLPTRSFRSENKHLAVVPRIYRARSGGRRFTYIAAKIWNQLPSFIRSEEGYMAFWKCLKTHLFN